jgi:hypothetical protein
MRRSFVDTLRDVRAGKVIDELDEQLQTLVQKVQSTIKGGSLVLTIEIKPLKGSAEAVIVKAGISCKMPSFDEAGTVLFPSPEGNLTRSHHRQPDLPGLALASAPPAPVTAPAAAPAAPEQGVSNGH